MKQIIDQLPTKKKASKNIAQNGLEPFSWLPPQHPAIAVAKSSKHQFYKNLQPLLSTIPLNRPQNMASGEVICADSMGKTGDSPPLVIRGERLKHLKGRDGLAVFQESLLLKTNKLYEVLEIPARDDNANKDAAIIDTLSVSLKISRYIEYVEFICDDEMIEFINRDLQMALGLKVGATINSKNFYKNTRALEHIKPDGRQVNLGFVAWGGNRDTINIHLTGVGCEHVTMNLGWERYAKYLQLLSANITRVDMAYDDFEGDKTVLNACDWYDQGLFGAGGNMPCCKYIEDKSKDQKEGCTLYVGKLKNGKEMCIYEKGKQLGSEDYPDWVRFEGRLGSKSRVIPHDVLLNPGQYLAAMYPCLSFISDKQVKIKTIIKAKVKATIDQGVENCRKQYGSYVLAVRASEIYTDKQLIDKLIYDKALPKHLTFPPCVDPDYVPPELDEIPFSASIDPFEMAV